MHLPDDFFRDRRRPARRLIGNYVHGTTRSSRAICITGPTIRGRRRSACGDIENQYRPTPDGPAGRRLRTDSAWYLFTALGFYPVAPAREIFPRKSCYQNASLNWKWEDANIEAVNKATRSLCPVELTAVPESRQSFRRDLSRGKLIFRMSDKYE